MIWITPPFRKGRWQRCAGETPFWDRANSGLKAQGTGASRAPTISISFSSELNERRSRSTYRSRMRGVILVVSLCWTNGLFAQTALVLERQNVVVFAKPKAAWMSAEAGLQLSVNDRLRTGELSRALVQFTNRAMLRLNELTSLTLTSPERGAVAPGLDLLGAQPIF